MDDGGAPGAAPAKPPIRRGRTGCFTCRKRRKKCDETKPECIGCRRSGYVCEGYPQTTFYQEKRGKSVGGAPRARGSASSSPPQPQPEMSVSQLALDSAANGIADWFMPDVSMDLPVAFDSDAATVFSDLSAVPMMSLAAPQHMDESSPEDQVMPHPSHSSALVESSNNIQRQWLARATSRPRDLPFLINGIETEAEQRFFSHFTKVTSKVLTISNDSKNPLLTTVLPRSLHDPMVQRAILCLGASHLLALQPEPENRLKVDKLRLLRRAENDQIQRITAAQSLSAAQSLGTTQGRTELDAILSCTLLLCLYEISEGSGDIAWRMRLNVARDLIQTSLVGRQREQSGSPDSPESAQMQPIDVDNFLLEFFIYHDILAAVTDRSRSPILSPSSVTSLTPENTYMIGVDNGLFDLLARVAALKNIESHGAMICEALVLWGELNAWHPDQTASRDQQLACSAYIAALFVWLYSIVNPGNIADDRVRKAIKDGMDDMKQVQGTGVLAFLLFPTFVLGFASITAEEREACSAQFERLHAFSKLGNVKLAHDLVKLSWNEYDNGHAQTWDWVQQMEKHGISLPVT